MENKSVALMTWHTDDNYGTVLQAYALREQIKKNGFEKVDLIASTPNRPVLKLIKRLKVNNLITKILLSKENIKNKCLEKTFKFNKFRESKFTFSKKCEDASDLFLLNDEYDKFVCGSDQIWSPILYDENYFLGFVKDNSKKIAYAPSLGLSKIENEGIKKSIKEQIDTFSALSIREEQGRKILKEITDKEIEVVLDPTLLLDKKEWNKLFNLAGSSEQYIVYYCLTNNKKHYSFAKKMARKLNKKLVIIPGNVIDYLHKNVINASPEEFLSLIYNAFLVITDSFHGTIFSVNFNVPFITLKRFKDNKLSQNSRIYNILKKVNLTSRLYNNNDKYFIYNYNINFDECNNILKKQRKKSIDYLINALKQNNDDSKTTLITKLCTGCGMCVNVCPKQCISLEQNENGFYSYKIDKEKCIKCNKCKKVCGQLSDNKNLIKDMKLYSARSLKEEVLINSSSGGMGYELALYAIENNMPVIGCTYDYDNNIAKHIVINKKEELVQLSGSKYIQSYTVDAFRELKNIECGMVIGTPCQIASVDNYLKILKKRDKFILVDLICHGVPTYHLWNKCISKYNKVSNVVFRDKNDSWHKKVMKINGSKVSDKKFYNIFESKLAFNKVCYQCRYRDKSKSDIRIGDYWGEKFKSDKKGVSMVVAGTNKGTEVLQILLNNKKIHLEEQSVQDYYNCQQTKNIPVPLEYSNIFNYLKNEEISILEIEKKYCANLIRYNKVAKLFAPIYKILKGK